MRFSIPALLLVFATGCTTGSTDALLKIEEAPPSRAEARTTGEFPKIGVIPKAQTKQLSESETAAAKAELRAAAQKGKAQRAQNTEAGYRREVRELQSLAKSQEEARIRAIEAAAELD